MKKTPFFICTAFMSVALLAGCDNRNEQATQNDQADNTRTAQEVTPASGGMGGAAAVARMDLVNAQGIGANVGSVTFMDTETGLEIRVDLDGLPPGQHGFHVHEKGDCSPGMQDGEMVAAGAAGGHYDPNRTGKHLGPDGGGHKGDLPILNVNPAGALTGVFQVDGVKVADFKGRALMIHEGGDNYLDEPVELGGGGARIACGVIR